jgi:hypothetical protein
MISEAVNVPEEAPCGFDGMLSTAMTGIWDIEHAVADLAEKLKPVLKPVPGEPHVNTLSTMICKEEKARAPIEEGFDVIMRKLETLVRKISDLKDLVVV